MTTMKAALRVVLPGEDPDDIVEVWGTSGATRADVRDNRRAQRHYSRRFVLWTAAPTSLVVHVAEGGIAYEQADGTWECHHVALSPRPPAFITRDEGEAVAWVWCGWRP